MSAKDDVREFLISRRANIAPEQAGLPAGGDRRVPGLRREEVAMLAGVSIGYYTKLERGKIRTASESVLNAIARALLLDDVERSHLFDLARATANASAVRTTRPPLGSLRTSLQGLLERMTVPALVYNTRHDLVGSNMLGRMVFGLYFEAENPNIARFTFLDSRAPEFYGDWKEACSLSAAMLRYEAGRDPFNAELAALIGELSALSPQFRTNWAEQRVHEHRTGRKMLHHPQVGDLHVTYDILEVPGEHGLRIATYSAEEEGETDEKVALLASLAAGSEHVL